MRRLVRTETVPLRSLWSHPLQEWVEAEYKKTSTHALRARGHESDPQWTDERKGLSKLSYLLTGRSTTPNSLIAPEPGLSSVGKDIRNYLCERYKDRTRHLRGMTSWFTEPWIRQIGYSQPARQVSPGGILTSLLECMTLDDQTAWVDSGWYSGDE